MGFFKIVAIITVPIAGMTYAAFSLGKQLPKASRRLGNYMGLSYVYFKCFLKVFRPQNQMTYEMIEMARKASQQSQALRSQIKNVMKRAKDDIRKRKEQALQGIDEKIKKGAKIVINEKQLSKKEDQADGAHLLLDLESQRRQLIQKKLQKVKTNKFYKQL